MPKATQDSKQKTITRFAPSPTGYLHVGASRTALFSWLWARKQGGEFHLRIEDTDRERLVADAEKQITESLEWLGLQWDGPVVHQSTQLATYQQHADQLVKAGQAYVSDEKDGKVTRFRWPEEKKPIEIGPFHGRLDVVVDPAAVPTAFEDFVLIKSDGYPTYNFAHVVDDIALGVTDVIRGDEFTPSLHKYYALYDALGASKQRPRYYHVPTILGTDGSKLSKRHGAVDVLEYRTAGYLPEALANFIALIGWNPGDEREVFLSLDELTEAFDLARVQKSPGVFDEEKLRWLNGEHLKAMDAGQLLARATEGGFWKQGKAAYDEKVLALVAGRAKTLADSTAVQQGYFYQRPKPTTQHLVGKENPETVGVWLERVLRGLGAVPDKDWKADQIENVLNNLRDELDLEPKQLYPVLRVAVTDADQTPPLWDIFAVLGKAETIARLEAAQSLVA